MDVYCVDRLCPNDEGSMSQDDATLKAGLQAKPPQGWAIGGVLSVVHGAVGSPSGHCLLTAHHLDSLWASWGFLSSEKVRSSLYQVGTPLRGSRLKAVCLTQYYIKMNAANSNLVPKT